MPFAWLPPGIAAGLWTGIGYGLLAFGLSRDGMWRLIALCSLPAVEAAQLAQWSPILTSMAVLPVLSLLRWRRPEARVLAVLAFVCKRG